MCDCGCDLREIAETLTPPHNIIRCPQCDEVYIIVSNLFNEVEILPIK